MAALAELTSETLLEVLNDLHDLCGGFDSREREGTASRSELRRWIKKGSVQVNGERPTSLDHALAFPIREFVLFPKGKRVTIL